MRPSPIRPMWFALVLTLARSIPGEIPTSPPQSVPFDGRTSWNGWTYYGGPMFVQGMAAEANGRYVWLATVVGLVRLDTEQARWVRWTTLDGLADNYTYDVEVDRQGTVWVASFGGLSRFDGTTFRNWRREDLGHHEYAAVAADSDGRVWLGCGASRTPVGAKCLLPNGTITHYNAWFLDAEFLHAVADIEPDPLGGVWIAGNEGVLPVDRGAGYYRPLQPRLIHVDRYGAPEQVTLDKDFWPEQLVAEKDGFLLALVASQPTPYWGRQACLLYRLTWDRSLRHETTQVPDFWKTSWKKLGEEDGLDAPVKALYRDPGNRVWIATERSIGLWENGKIVPRIELPPEKGKTLYRVAVLADGARALFCVNRQNEDPGIFLWNGKAWSRLVNPLDGPVRPGRGFPIIGIHGRDLQGRLHFMRDQDTVFDGTTWTVQKREIEFIYDRYQRPAGTYVHNPQTKTTVMSLKGRPEPVTHKALFGVDLFPAKFVDSRGHFWAFDDDLKEFDGKAIIDHVPGNEFFLRKIPGVGIYNRTVRGLAEDAKGRLWLGTTSGLLRHAGGTTWHWVGGRFDGMFGMMGWHFSSNGRDLVSFAGTWGTSEYHLLEEKWLNFTEKGRRFPGAEPTMPGSYVEIVVPDIQGRLWYGTYEGGACCRDSDGRFESFSTEDGLASNSCWGIWCDDDGLMWFTTQAGAQSLDLKTFQRKQSRNP